MQSIKMKISYKKIQQQKFKQPSKVRLPSIHLEDPPSDFPEDKNNSNNKTHQNQH